MRFHTLFLLSLLMLATCQPCLSVARASNVTTELVLYAHTDPHATSVGGRTLSLSSNTTLWQAADMDDGLTFTLVPSLSAPLHILGRIDLYVWLTSPSSVLGTLQAILSEVSANGSLIEIRSVSVTVTVPTIPYLVIFGLGPVDETIGIGSTLRLRVQFLPSYSVPVLLLWDDPSTATRLVLKIESVPKISLTVADTSGRVTTIFPENEAGIIRLRILVSIEDPFHGTSVRMVSMSVSNSSGTFLLKSVPMNITSRVEQPFRLGYALPIAIPHGTFNFTVTVSDISGRIFAASKKIIVTKFHTLGVVVVDGQNRPLPNLNVSITSGGESVDEVTTDSTGSATAHVPSSSIAPLLLQIHGNGPLNYSRAVESEVNSTITIVMQLYDWSIIVRSEDTGLPVSAARVQLFLNGTLIGSRLAEPNGTARFTAIPPGSYDVIVNSTVGAANFDNKTHLPKYEETILLIHTPPPPVSFPTIFIFSAVIIAAIAAAIVILRRKMKPSSIKHIAELLGGSVPQSSTIMIVGPSGSGKSILLQNILVDLLQLDRCCVYASNSEPPSNIRTVLSRMGLKAETYEKRSALRFIDAYSGETGAVSSEEHSVRSPRDLTALGIQITSCVDELGGKADIFLDSLTPIATSDSSEHALEFVRYYGARTTKSGGTFLYVASTATEPMLLSQLEEASDCVLQTERLEGRGKTIGRLLVKKARGVEHARGWFGLKIATKGRVEFISSPNEIH